MIYDLVIKGGTLVTATDMGQADLAIQGEQIAAIGRDLTGARILDARDRLVIPGGVDPHVHLQMPTGITVSSDDWMTGTRAAAFGGTTTVLDFVEPEPGETLLEAFEKRRAEAEGVRQNHTGAAIDYGLHMTLNQPALAHLDQVVECAKLGLTSFKTYTTYDGFKLTDDEFLRVMDAIHGARGLMLTHCENDAVIQKATAVWLERAPDQPSSHGYSRPAAAEAMAIRRVIDLAAFSQIPLYVVHVSTEAGAQIISEARARGLRVVGETCPQYFLLNDQQYQRPDFEGAKYVCSPPLRSESDQNAIWRALHNGDLQAVGTDHCPFNVAGQKDLGRDDFTKIPGGLPGIESRVAVTHTGIGSERLTLMQWVKLCSTNPARIFGLYPRKGSLLPGADADVVIFNPAWSKTPLTYAQLHENVDYTPYENANIAGWPETTISRGEIIVHDGEFIGSPGRGHYLKRGQFINPL